MSRRRSNPWIHRWSRPLIGAIAIIGAILTTYLTITKLTGADVGCVAASAAAAPGCNDVLNSAYASIFGLPLPLFGLGAYLFMAVCALVPLAIDRDRQKRTRSPIEQWTWLFLLIGSTSMVVFSGYLMYLLAFELKAVCLYCIGSAIFSLALFLLTLLGHDWEDIGQVFFTGIIVALVTIVGTLAVYANVNNPLAEGDRQVIPVADTRPEPGLGWEITTTSGPSEIALAEHLSEVGAAEYGAYWCPHCYEQKQLFGKQAFAKLDYIECDPEGKNAQPQACVDAEVRSYPTWKIDGEVYTGTQPLEKLAEVSNYTGPTDFKYQLPGR
ncbi:MAG: vitamin K epoxide reductase family protein [Jaaginema sp. PMC 1079.18]|nr:vitamin K epoxide reductase family protein [Jaaginema sp. PMC 1080.18]MEC4850428.1 vitamin K epoxide reductase family protein [Jaaginema sp. PMC 1079.18]MEC4866551.1 vitamin K epoxide reductase family protein [Jaaginema sp. PMC 1078.18]